MLQLKIVEESIFNVTITMLKKSGEYKPPIDAIFPTKTTTRTNHLTFSKDDTQEEVS